MMNQNLDQNLSFQCSQKKRGLAIPVIAKDFVMTSVPALAVGILKVVCWMVKLDSE